MEEVIEIIKAAKKLSIKALNQFYINLGIDPKQITEIYRPMRFKKTDKKEYAHYEPEEDEIILNYKLADYIKNSLDRTNNKDAMRTKLIMEIANTIIHETIHSARTIIRKPNDIDEEYLLYMISYRIEPDYTPLRMLPNKVIHGKTRDDINTSDFINKVDKYFEQINHQLAIEECITEALAQIILNLYVEKGLTFEKAVQSVIEKPDNRKDAVVGAKIIQNIDFKLIPWFLTTRFQANYHDLFHQTWGESYKLLLSNINRVYQKTFNDTYSKEDELIDKKNIANIDEILERKQKKIY